MVGVAHSGLFQKAQVRPEHPRPAWGGHLASISRTLPLALAAEGKQPESSRLAPRGVCEEKWKQIHTTPSSREPAPGARRGPRGRSRPARRGCAADAGGGPAPTHHDAAEGPLVPAPTAAASADPRTPRPTRSEAAAAPGKSAGVGPWRGAPGAGVGGKPRRVLSWRAAT